MCIKIMATENECLNGRKSCYTFSYLIQVIMTSNC